MEYQGHLIRHNVHNRLFYPNAHYVLYSIPIPNSTPLVAD